MVALLIVKLDRSKDFELGGRQKYHMVKIVLGTAKMVNESLTFLNGREHFWEETKMG